MADIPLRTRKRDKLKRKLGFAPSLSGEAPRPPGVESSTIGLASLITSNPAPSNSAAVGELDLTANNSGSGLPNVELSDATNPRPSPSPSSPTNRDSDLSPAPTTSTTPHPIEISQHTVLPSTITPLPCDLWADALHKLSPQDREAIERLRPSPGTQKPLSETIPELLGLTRKAHDECKAKSYKFRFREKDIIMRDVVGKIIFWLNKFKEVGDIVVNFDPVHAALPWAGVRFLLQAAIGEHEQMGEILVATEKISCVIARGVLYERLYQPGTIREDISDNFYRSLIELYAETLRTMALIYQLSVQSIVKRTMHAIFDPSKVSNFLEKCKELEVQVEFEVQNCERARSHEADRESQKLLEILQEPILRTDQNVLTLLENIDEEKRLKVLDWISNVLYGLNHKNVKEKRTANTCKWLLNHSRYEEWQDTSSSVILWLCGTAGTGKTFLTSTVIDEVRTLLDKNPNEEGFAFFYCNRNEAERREPLSVLRAFVRQLSTTASEQHSIQKRLNQYYKNARLKASGPTIGDCKELLLELVNIYPRTTLVLDALDECEKHKRLELIETLDYILAEASNPLKIFISSRPDGDIKERLKDRANIAINATDNQDDISKFVNSEIAKHRKWGKITAELKVQIVETLQHQSQGMFQWAYLQIKQLLELQRPGEIAERLGKLPKDLKVAYDEIYNKMEEREKQIADRAFQWVMCAARPLETRELLPAICQDENSDTLLPLDGLDEDLVLEYCHNLLVIDPVRKVWVPSHLSVIEYFESHLWSQGQANSLVSSVCLVVLQNRLRYDIRRARSIEPYSRLEADSSSDGNSSSDENTVTKVGDIEKESATTGRSTSTSSIERYDTRQDQEFDYLCFYATHHWAIHARRSTKTDNANRLSKLLDEFLGSPTNSSFTYRCWLGMTKKSTYKNTPRTSLFEVSSIEPAELLSDSIASFAYCAFDLVEILPNWHDFQWVKYDHRTNGGETYLQLAARTGAVNTCLELIKNGSEVDAQTATNCGSALASAAWHRQTRAVELLVKGGGAEVNMQLQYGSYGSALAAAATTSSSSNKEVIKFLVKEGGAEVNMQLQHGNYGSALAAATAFGDTEVVEFLVKEGGAEVNMQLQHGNYGSALAAAAGNSFMRNTEVVEFLVKEGGAEVNMQLQHGNYGSALAAAAAAAAGNSFLGNSEVLKFLVKEGGAEVNMQLQYGSYGSALAAAAATAFDNIEVVKFLVKEGGAEVNMQLQHGNYGSALAAAAAGNSFMRNTEVVEFLVKEGGAEVNMQLQHGKYANALDAAENSWTLKIAQLLITLGARRQGAQTGFTEDEDSDESEDIFLALESI